MSKRRKHSFKTDSDSKADWIKAGTDDASISNEAIKLLQLSKKKESPSSK